MNSSDFLRIKLFMKIIDMISKKHPIHCNELGMCYIFIHLANEKKEYYVKNVYFTFPDYIEIS
jgi:hypothetical protein